MSDMVQDTQDTLERHQHLHHNPDDGNARRAAIVIGVLAAVLAVAEMAERSSQNAYLSHHIGASDDFAFYQARLTRAMVLTQSAATLDAMPPTPQVQKAATDARAEARRLTEDSDRGNGVKQIQGRAEAEIKARDVALHKYECYEIVTSALQIAIVLASVSVVTRLKQMTFLGVGIGVLAAALGAVVAAGFV